MTKTLTEQWREGTLPAGYYYIIANTKARNQVIFYLPENTNTDGAVIKGEVVNGEDGGWVVEVLDPVPSYSEYQALKDNCELTHTRLKGTHQKIAQLKKQLAKAIDALKDFCGTSTSWDEVRCREYLVKQKLKEIKGLK